MHFSLPVLAVLCSSINLTLSSVVPSTNQLLDRGTTLESPANPGLKERNGAWTCTPENVHVRNEWYVNPFRSLIPTNADVIQGVLCPRMREKNTPMQCSVLERNHHYIKR